MKITLDIPDAIMARVQDYATHQEVTVNRWLENQVIHLFDGAGEPINGDKLTGYPENKERLFGMDDPDANPTPKTPVLQG